MRPMRAIADWDPFLAPQLVVAGALALDLLLPNKLTIGPVWLLPGFQGGLLVGLLVLSPHPRVRHSRYRRHAALALTAVVSLANSVSLVLLCHYLLRGGRESGRTLIASGIVLWVTNVLLFGVWYWQLDRGGPVARASRTAAEVDFMFPQMTDDRWAPEGWTPGLVDYLYVSFTNATAFSPTDAMPLTQSAKLLMSLQALTALLTVGLVVARAVNILA
jgi:hypothetical protein